MPRSDDDGDQAKSFEGVISERKKIMKMIMKENACVLFLKSIKIAIELLSQCGVDGHWAESGV
jgi:hypothetical protein